MRDAAIRPRLVDAILTDAGKPNAKVTVLTNPRLEGYDHAVKAIREELPDSYGFWDLWLFIPDGDRAKPEAMTALEGELAKNGIKLLCCPAQPEVEIYACVPYRGELKEGWEAARADVRFKADVFDPLLARHGDERRAGSGRDLMLRRSGEELAGTLSVLPRTEGPARPNSRRHPTRLRHPPLGNG